MNKDGSLTIKLKPITYNELRERGGYEQSMDDIVYGLLHPDIIKSKLKRKKENLMKK
jgi:hypothetical protein